MSTLTIQKETLQPVEVVMGTFKFHKKQLKSLHSAVFKALEAAHTDNYDLYLTPSEAAVLGSIMLQIEESGILDT